MRQHDRQAAGSDDGVEHSSRERQPRELRVAAGRLRIERDADDGAGMRLLAKTNSVRIGFARAANRRADGPR